MSSSTSTRKARYPLDESVRRWPAMALMVPGVEVHARPAEPVGGPVDAEPARGDHEVGRVVEQGREHGGHLAGSFWPSASRVTTYRAPCCEASCVAEPQGRTLAQVDGQHAGVHAGVEGDLGRAVGAAVHHHEGRHLEIADERRAWPSARRRCSPPPRRRRPGPPPGRTGPRGSAGRSRARARSTTNRSSGPSDGWRLSGRVSQRWRWVRHQKEWGRANTARTLRLEVRQGLGRVVGVEAGLVPLVGEPLGQLVPRLVPVACPACPGPCRSGGSSADPGSPDGRGWPR